MEIKKHDGTFEEFNISKARKGIQEAYAMAGENKRNPDVTEILDVLSDKAYDGMPSSEIRRIIEEELTKRNFNAGRQYILHWAKRESVNQFVLDKEQFIAKYKASANNADATIDDNSNVGNKNIGLINAEIHKTDNILISRGMITHKLEELYPRFNSKNYVKDLESHIIYKNDESSFAGAISPYCCSISMYPFLLDGIEKIGGLSAAPKNIDSFCGMYCNLLFAVASQFAGACMYKDQEIFVQENGVGQKYKSKDFVEKYLNSNITTFENYQGEWEYAKVPEGVTVLEDGKCVPVKKVYRRRYNDKIYTIKTKDGYSAKVSKDHIFRHMLKCRVLETKASELIKGDTVFMNKDFNSAIAKDTYDYKRGWIIGMLCGDGHLTQENSVMLSVNYEQKFLGDIFNEYLDEIFGYRLNEGNGHACFSYHKYNKELYAKVEEDIIGKDTYTKHINIEGKTIDYLTGFLDGLFCSDGSYSKTHGISISLTNIDLINNVADITRILGVCDKKPSVIPAKENRRESYQLYIPAKVIKYLLHTPKKAIGKGQMTINEDGYPKESRELYYYGKDAIKGNNKSNERNLWTNSHRDKDKQYKTDVIDSIEITDNDDNYVYEIETESHWYNCGGFITHNCATPEVLTFFDYFARKEWGDDYYLHADDAITTDKVKRTKTIRSQIRQYLQQICYSINQMAGSRNMQSPFTNFGYFDKPFFDSMFGNFYFPDGSRPKWESLNWLQQEFMMWFNDERLRCLLTFPVESFALIYKDGKFVDEENARFVAEELARGHSFFIYISDTADSLSSCCRLKNKIQTKEFNFTNGNLGVETGSKSVISLNLSRITQDFCRKEFGTRPKFTEFTEENKENYKKYLTKILDRVYKYHNAYNELLWDMYDANLLPVYKAGFIDLNKQYLTIGLNGLNQAAEYLGLECHKNQDYSNFCRFIFGTIKRENERHKTKKTNFNTEQVPAESLAVKNYNWDKEDGYWVPEDTNLYASYIFKPNENDSVLDKIYMMSSHFATDMLDGGSAAHIGLEEHLTADQYMKLLNYAGEVGCNYLTFNVVQTRCPDCGFITKRPLTECPKCGNKDLEYYDRVIGYLTKISNWSEGRRIEQKTRVYLKKEDTGV